MEKEISNWLKVGGIKTPNRPKFPNKEQMKLWFNMSLEEAIEAIEASSGDTIKDCIPILEEKLDKLKAFHEDNPRKKESLTELRDSCADQKFILTNLLHFSGLVNVFEEDVEAVLESNYSKYCETEQEAEETCDAYENGYHPDKEGEVIYADYREENGVFVVFNSENGKILKSVNYQEPKIK